MTALDYLFLGVIAVVLIIFAGFLVLTMAGNPLLINWLQSSDLVLDGVAPALILLLLAVYLALLIARQKRKRSIVYEKELGAVRVSVGCIESLIQEAAAKVAGVKEARARIVNVAQPKVNLDIRIFSDFNIPQLTEELQESVKDYVNSSVGINLEEVEVAVVGIAPKDRPEIDEPLL